MEGQAVNSIKDASEELISVAQGQVTVEGITLSGGAKVKVETLGWMEALPFLKLFTEIAQALPRLLRSLQVEDSIKEREFTAFMPGGFINPASGAEIGRVDADQTRVLIEALTGEKQANAELQDQALGVLIGKLGVAPEELFKLACVSTGKSAEFYSDKANCRFGEVLRIGFIAARINFFDNPDLGEIRDFFGGALSRRSAALMGQAPGAD